MTENTAKTITLESALAQIEPEPVRVMVGEKLETAAKLIRENNSRVARVREAKATDPNNTEYLDNVWHRVIADKVDDKEMTQAEKRYQAAVQESEKQLTILRNAAKARHIQAPLSEEEIAKTKKLVNEGKAVITAARTAAESFAEMADKMLESLGKPAIEGGFISLLPQADSLLNARGRKSSGGSGETGNKYATRVIEIEVDGKSTNREKKNKQGVMAPAAHFNFVADDLSKMFGASQFAQNEVSAEEIEQAYYASRDVTFREAKDMPEDYTFKFTKDVTVQNPNDDSTKVEPVTKNIRVVRWTKDTIEEVKAETEKVDAEKK